MQGTLLKNINVRLLPNKDSADLGNLYAGEVVYGPVVNGWIQFNRVYHPNGVIDDGTKGYAAVKNPVSPFEPFMTLADVPEPVPTPETPPAAKPLNIVIGGDDYETVTVTLNPK
jgi:hypothetical protein